MDSAVIIIPTTGASTLYECLASAVEQDWSNTRVLVVVDGPQFEEDVRIYIADATSGKSEKNNVSVMVLPYNTGANGWYGHRIYAAANFLVDQDWIFYLDQDNWFDPNHVSSQIESCKMQGYAWGHSLRKICDVSGNYLLDDNCESLGKYPTYVDSNSHLVDTSAFCIRRDVAIRCGAAWHGQWGADRQFLHNINHFYPNWGGTGKYTLNYRLAGNPGSVTREFFEIGNRVMKERYPDQFPWNEWRITI